MFSSNKKTRSTKFTKTYALAKLLIPNHVAKVEAAVAARRTARSSNVNGEACSPTQSPPDPVTNGVSVKSAEVPADNAVDLLTATKETDTDEKPSDDAEKDKQVVRGAGSAEDKQGLNLVGPERKDGENDEKTTGEPARESTDDYKDKEKVIDDKALTEN